MKIFPSIQNLLGEQNKGGPARRSRRLPVLEPLESRCVLAGFEMHENFEFHFEVEGRDRDHSEIHSHEEHRYSPNSDHGRAIEPQPQPEGEYEPSALSPPELTRGLGGFAPEPRPSVDLPPAGTSGRPTFPQVVIIVTRLPEPIQPLTTSAPTLSELDHPNRGPETSSVVPASNRPSEANRTFLGTASIAAAGDFTAAGLRGSDLPSVSGIPLFTVQARRDEESVRNDSAAAKLAAKELPAAQIKAILADSLIELDPVDPSQRLKRRLAEAAKDAGPPPTEKLERLATTLRREANIDLTQRVPPPEEANDRVLASWQANGPAWSPEDAGLIEILATDLFGSARNGSLPAAAEVRGRHDSNKGLQAEVQLFQAFDLASDQPAETPIATTTAVTPSASRQPVRGAHAE